MDSDDILLNDNQLLCHAFVKRETVEECLCKGRGQGLLNCILVIVCV